MDKRAAVIIFLLSFVLLAGCVAKPIQYLSDKKMIPSLNGDFFSSDKKLLVREVTGGGKTLIRPRIGHVNFQKALIEVLKQSGMFKEVMIEGTEKEEKEEKEEIKEAAKEEKKKEKEKKKKKEDEYLLNTRIIYGGMQRDKEVMGENAYLFVQYVLFGVNKKKELWRKIIFSEYGTQLGKEYIDNERIKMSYEGAARDNLTQLASELSQVLSSQEK